MLYRWYVDRDHLPIKDHLWTKSTFIPSQIHKCYIIYLSTKVITFYGCKCLWPLPPAPSTHGRGLRIAENMRRMFTFESCSQCQMSAGVLIFHQKSGDYSIAGYTSSERWQNHSNSTQTCGFCYQNQIRNSIACCLKIIFYYHLTLLMRTSEKWFDTCCRWTFS